MNENIMSISELVDAQLPKDVHDAVYQASDAKLAASEGELATTQAQLQRLQAQHKADAARLASQIGDDQSALARKKKEAFFLAGSAILLGLLIGRASK